MQPDRSFTLAWLCLALLSASPAAAMFENGQFLYDRCQEESGSLSDGVCSGFITGVFDANRDAYCAGSEVTADRLRDVAVSYMRDSAEVLTQPAGSIVHDALSKAFPCSQR